MPAECSFYTSPSTGLAIGTKVLVSIPCLCGATLWNSDIWQGSVTDGNTVCAFIVLKRQLSSMALA